MEDSCVALHDFYGLAYEVGLLGLRQGVWGEQRIISVGCLENNKALEAREGVSTWLDHRDPQDGRNGFVRLENAQCGLEVQGSASADLRQKAFCRFVVAEGGSASHDGGFTSSFR